MARRELVLPPDTVARLDGSLCCARIRKSESTFPRRAIFWLRPVRIRDLPVRIDKLLGAFA